MISFICWCWGSKYTREHVWRLRAGIARNYGKPHRFVCVTDDKIDGVECWPIANRQLLTALDGCWARLRQFDPAWQIEHQIRDAFVCLDLDIVIVRDIEPLFDRDEDFVILEGGHFNPCPVNGSVMMIRPGARPELWSTFTIGEAWDVAYADGHNRGTDQTWIAAKAPDAATWKCGPKSQIYAMGKPNWPGGHMGINLPADARIVAMPGWRDPAKMIHVPWVAENWRM